MISTLARISSGPEKVKQNIKAIYINSVLPANETNWSGLSSVNYVIQASVFSCSGPTVNYVRQAPMFSVQIKFFAFSYLAIIYNMH